MRLVVGYPWDSPFMYSACAESIANLDRPEGTRFVRGVGWCPARRHIDICEKALMLGAQYICILGADQVYPQDLLPRLLHRINSGYEVMTALVPTRGVVDFQPMKPFEKMAWRFKKGVMIDGFKGVAKDQHKIDVIDPKDGDVQRVNFIGSGVLMFHVDHLKALEKPWFSETLDPVNYYRIANMDCTFVWRLQTEAHASVWVDTTIDVKHLDVFQIDSTFPERFEDWTNNALRQTA